MAGSEKYANKGNILCQLLREYMLTGDERAINIIDNNVAHAFYIPQDYEIMRATLVFLAILSLTMYRTKNKENK